jgi:hypothetical protein
MRTRRIPILLGGALCALAALSCDSPTDSRQLPENELIFLRATDEAPPLDSLVVHVWAKAGEGRQAVIRYQKVGSYGGDICLEFKIPGDGLYKRPDGTEVQKGDSVLITITVLDPKLFNFRFEPAGLQFRQDKPAELRVSYKWADRDFNGDGVENGADARFRFDFWKQEVDGGDWYQVGTVKDANVEELRANIRGFTKYAMAGD